MTTTTALLAASTTRPFETLDVWYIAISAFLVAVSGVLALAETALTRMSRVKAIALQEEGRKGAKKLVKLVSHPESFLNSLLLLLMLCHFVTATLLGLVFDGVFGSWGIVAAVGVDILIIFVFAEAAPKTWAVMSPEKSALLVAPLIGSITNFPPVRWMSRMLIGLANVVIRGKGLREGPYVTESEILALADAAADEDVIEREERQLIHSIIDFGDTVVREVMVPRPDMFTIKGSATIDAAIDVIVESGFSRVPVIGDGIDDVLGIVYAKDLMRAHRAGRHAEFVSEIVRPAKFLPDSKAVAHLMREMQREKYHMALLVDEYGGTAGLVTLEDLIEELIGDIVDEFDVEEAEFEKLPGGDVRVSGGFSIDELNDVLESDLPSEDWDTVGGLILGLSGRVPGQGEVLETLGYRFAIERVQGRRISTVRVSRLPERTKPDHE